jgi:hypothetical protein
VPNVADSHVEQARTVLVSVFVCVCGGGGKGVGGVFGCVDISRLSCMTDAHCAGEYCMRVSRGGGAWWVAVVPDVADSHVEQARTVLVSGGMGGRGGRGAGLRGCFIWVPS